MAAFFGPGRLTFTCTLVECCSLTPGGLIDTHQASKEIILRLKSGPLLIKYLELGESTMQNLECSKRMILWRDLVNTGEINLTMAHSPFATELSMQDGYPIP
jgi:hypothetical protein